jgi:hypothetical protein
VSMNFSPYNDRMIMDRTGNNLRRTHRLDDKLEWHAVRPSRLLGEVEYANNLVVFPSRKLLGGNFLSTCTHQYMRQSVALYIMTYLGIDVSLWQVTEHLVGVELALMLSVLGHLEYPDFAALARSKLDLFVLRELLA